MPKRSASLKPSSKSFSRRRRSHTTHSSVKPVPHDGTEVGTVSSIVPPFSSSTSPLFSLPLPPMASTSFHSSTVSGPSSSASSESLSTSSSLPSLIPPNSPFLAASTSPSLRFSSTTSSDASPSLPSKPCLVPSTPSNSSSLPPPSSVLETQQTPPVVGTSSPNSSASHDALYEYVKGLQEAIKSGDADFAERLLQELGEAANSPAAVALMVSANGARLIASTVRQFRWHGLQKPAKGSMKGGRAGFTKTSLSAKQLEADPANPPGRSGGSENTRSDDGCIPPESCQSFTSSDHSDGKSLALSHVEIAPTGIAAPNESRRKRQRTSGELEEEDDVKEGFANEVRGSAKAEGSTRSVGEFSGQLRGGTEVSRSIAAVAAVSRTLGRDNVGLEGTTAEDTLRNIAARVVRIKGRYTRIVGSRRYTREPLKVKDRTEISECGQSAFRLETSDKGAVLAGGSELCVKQEVVSNRNVSEQDVINQANTFCPECVVPGDANPRMSEGVTIFDGTVDPVAGSHFRIVVEEEIVADQTCPNSGTDLTLSSSSSSENTKSGVCDSRTLSRPPNKKLQVDQSAIGLQALLAQANKEIGTRKSPSDSASDEVAGPSGQSTEGEVLDIVPATGSTSATFEFGPSETTAAARNHSSEAGRGSIDSGNQGASSKSQDMELFSGAGKTQVASLEDKRMTSKWSKVSVLDKQDTRAEHSGSEEKKRETPSVYSLAKGAGMPDVVAEGCSALDKLATTAFRGKGTPAGGKMAAVTGVAAARRGKTFSAEMYVALTEAFVDLLQVLKDNVALLSWCLGCLGSILPPSSSDRNSSDSSLSIPASSKAPYVTNKELLKVTTGKGVKHDGSPGVSSQQHSARSFAEDQPVVKEKETKSSKSLPKSATASYAAAALSAGNGKSSGNAFSTGSGLASESTASSISALAAVAYAATVPMLAEKAVKAVLNAMQSCDIEAHSTHSALRALSAHLSSTNSKYVCDDAFAFIIAAMREFVSDAEMQAESCIALVSLPRAVSSATGHAAWAAISVSMDHHRRNLMVQRAGCGTLQLLCTRTGLGVPEWGSGKRPLRAAKDADRETGARALIAAMAAFPEDVRIQWHGCSTLWTLVHSAGVRSVANMVRHGAVAAVVGAMSVCRINELMQQEGCNVLGTMARTLAENGHDVGPLICPVVSDAQKVSGSTGSDQVGSSNERDVPEEHQKHGTGAGKRRDRKDGPPTSPDDWWAALWAVVSAMKAFNKSKSLQSNGTFALGCILKGSGDNFHATSGLSPMPGMPLSNSKPSESGLASRRSGTDLFGKPLSEGGPQASYSGVGTDGAGFSSRFPHSLTGKDVVDDVERMDAAFEVTMTAMREFPKVETVQVWGCAVLQQAFLAYVHYAKRFAPVSMGLEASLSAAISAPNGASVFPPLSTIFRTPSSFGNTDCLPKSSPLACTSTFPVSSSQPAPMNAKIPSPLSSSKSSSKFFTAAKSAASAKPDTWRFSTPMSSLGQGTDNSINVDRSEGRVAGETQSSSSLGVLHNTYSSAVPGPLDGRTISNEEVYFPSEKSSTAFTSQSQAHSGRNTSGARSMVSIGCTPPVSFGESSGAGKDHAFAVNSSPLFSAQKSLSKVLSFSSPASSAGLSRGSPCPSNLTAAGSFQKKSEFKSLTNGHQFLSSPSPVEEDFGRGRTLFSSIPHSTSSLPQPTPLVAPPCDFANLILSNATKAMKMISKTMKLSCSSASGSSAQPLTKSGSGAQAAKSNLKMTTTKSLASRSPAVSVNHSFASVRQSWCAALGAIGDVFGHLTRGSEVALGKGVPRGTDFLEIYKDRKHMHQLGIVEQPSEWNARVRRKDNEEEAEIEHSDDEEEANVTLNALTIWTHTMAMNGPNLTQCSADVKAYMDAVVQQYKVKEKKNESGVEKDDKNDSCSSTRGDVSERSNGTSDWFALDTVSQEQAVKDIKAWQEATESMGRIAERAGFPKAVKKSILAIRKILEKLEDAETVIWACHALVSLYLTWENVHLFRPGIEIDREEFKSRIWGIGEVGVQQLVDLVIHWTHQNRPDVTSLALQALYSACVFAATVQEIEEVFGPGESGAEAVIGAMQKALISGGTAHQRRKVIQQACCVLTTVCGYSIRAQVAVAAAGGADVILAALDRYDEDSQIQVNGMHALGLDARLQPDFDTLWNAAIYRTAPGGVKWSRRKKGSSSSGATLVGLTHIYKEGIGLPSGQNASELGSHDDSKGEQRPDGSWTPQLERLLLDGASQLGLFRTGLIASPGCGGPAFAVELFKRLGRGASCCQNAVEMQVHVCLVIGYMTAHDSKWRRDFIESGAVEAILAAMEFLHKQNRETIVTSFGLMCDGVEVGLDARIDPRDLEKSRQKASPGNIKNVSRSTTIDTSLAEPDEGRAIREVLEARLQCAASWALAGLVKDSVASTSHSTLNVIQALAVALLRFGSITCFKPPSARAEKVHAEVCTPARLALARLGVFRIGSREHGRFLPHDAAEAGDVICLQTLASKGVDLLMVDSQGQTALMCAERAGKIGAVQFLREYGQLQGKRKAREKAKAKNKQGSRKTKSFDQNEISEEKSTVSLELTTAERSNVVEVQDVQELSSNAAGSGRVGPRNMEDESDDRHSVSSAVVVTEMLTGEVESSKEESRDGAEAAYVAPVEETRVETKGKATEKKRGKGQKARDVKESKEDCSHRDDEMSNRCGHPSNERSESRQVDLITREVTNNNDFAPQSRETSSNPQKASAEQVSAKAGDVSNSEETEELNVMLRQAMSSGDVENLQAALSCCASSGSQADESLVKKVKAALAKRLKRMEKAAALQENLSAAIEEADSRRLREAISDIEEVPRFSVVFKSQLESAKVLLFDLESRERMLENIDTQAASDRSSNLDEVHSIWSEENLEAEEDSTGRASEWSFVEREEKEILAEGDEPNSLNSENVESLTWTDVYKGKGRRKEKDSGELSTGSLPYYREKKGKGFRCRRAKGALLTSDEEMASSSLVQLTAAEHDAPVQFSRPHDLSENSLFAAEPLTSLSTTATSEPIPPLLPIPPHASTVSPVLQPSRSVIMPPRSTGRGLYSPSGHEPITPQLFPVTKGGSLDHFTDHRWGGHFALDSDESPIGSHMARMFASQWSPPYRDDPFQPELQPGSDRRADQSGSTSDSSDSLASLLASIFQSNFSRSSFSTLFSTSFGEIPTPRTVTPDPEPAVKVVASPIVQPVLLSQVSTPVLNVHARPFLPAKTQKAAGPSLPHPSVHHGPPLPVQYSSQSLNASEFPESLSRISSGSFSMSSMPGGLHQQSAMFHSSIGNQEVPGEALDRMGMLLDHHQENGLGSVPIYHPFSQNEPSPGSSLQENALLAASMEESCCICFDMPKDAALIPCGHRMCKGCAEEMRRIRHHCPICNRSIDAVLALYG